MAKKPSKHTFGHAINLIAGYQTAFTTLIQVCFALAWGLFAAAVYADTGSIWPVFVFHALFDAIQLAGVHQTTTPVDMTTLAVMASAAMVIGIRVSNSAVTSPNGVSGRGLSVGCVQR